MWSWPRHRGIAARAKGLWTFVVGPGPGSQWRCSKSHEASKFRPAQMGAEVLWSATTTAVSMPPGATALSRAETRARSQPWPR